MMGTAIFVMWQRNVPGSSGKPTKLQYQWETYTRPHLTFAALLHLSSMWDIVSRKLDGMSLFQLTAAAADAHLFPVAGYFIAKSFSGITNKMRRTLGSSQQCR